MKQNSRMETNLDIYMPQNRITLRVASALNIIAFSSDGFSLNETNPFTKSSFERNSLNYLLFTEAIGSAIAISSEMPTP